MTRPRAARRSRGSGRSGRRPARWRAARRRGTGRPLVPQCPRGCQRRVEVGHLRVLVPPRSEHRTVLADEERAPPRRPPSSATPAARRLRARRSNRRGAARRRRARPSRPGATSASRERRRRPAPPPARTPAACHAGGAAPGFRSATSRRGRRRAGPAPPRAAPRAPSRRRCRARTRAESTRCATAIKVGSTTPRSSGRSASGTGRRRPRLPGCLGRPSRVKTSWSSAHPTTRQRPSRPSECARGLEEGLGRVAVEHRAGVGVDDPDGAVAGRAYASRWPGPDCHTGARSAAWASSRWSPVPSPPTTRNAPGRNTRSACRSSCRPARQARIRSRERPAHRPAGRQGDELVRPRRDDEAAEGRPRRLAVRPQQPLRAVLLHHPRARVRDHEQPTRSREEKSAGALSSTPTTSRISSRTARPAG